MRTKTLLFAAVLSVAALATSKAQDVTSINFVGYVNVAVAPGFNLLANPLSNGDNTAATVIGDLPAEAIGSSIFTWNGTGYDSDTYVGAWGTNPALPPGSAFFLENIGAGAIDLTLVGEGALGDASNMNVAEGLQFLGSLVPQEGTLTDLGFPFTNEDNFFTWNGVGFDSVLWLEGVGFLGDEPTIGVAEGFIVDKTAAADWNRDFSIE